ncbi:MAG: molybdopterin cofactor-binding domain-containing protein [Pseudomonadota bacterium]|nr:molybdopterin cofactor-binding domain-containing protein [Pseudomonadota bacterium]
MRNKKFSRRSFLISSAAGASSLVFAKSIVNAKEAVDLLNPASPLVLPPNFAPSVWFTMESNGRTTVHIFRNEMGQHVGTSLAQIVAEELCLSWKDVTIDYPQMDSNTYGTYGMQLTGGSWSVVSEFDKLSKVSAAARQIIVESGADLLGADLADCIAENSIVKDTLMGEKISFSEILSETVIDYQVTEEDLATVNRKEKKDYKIIGRSVPALDIPEKINGSARYAIDAQVPNMVYGKIIAPPKRLGAKIISIDDKKAKQIKGYITTIPFNFPDEALDGGILTHVPLVVASDYPSAMRAAKLIDVNWNTDACSTASSADFEKEAYKLLKDGKNGRLSWKIGEYDTCGEGKECKKLERSYKTSMVAHVALEPMSALVNFDNGVLHIYAGHQVGTLLPNIIGQFTGISSDKIIYHPHLVGGSFGKRTEFGMIALASMASIQLKKPIKLILTREDDMAFSHPRTPTVQRLEAVISGEECLGYKQEIASATMQFDKLMPQFLRNPIVDGVPVESENKIEGFTVVGADNWYDIENQTVNYFRQASVEDTIPVRNVRSVGNNYTVFATETFIDEVSQEIGVDPMAFRLNYLNGVGINAGSNTPASYGGGKRLANVLKIASGLANYGLENLGEYEGLGIAITGAENRWAPCFLALVAKVKVDKNSAAIDVQKLICVLDVGIAINPDGIKAQVEGSLLWGLSNALLEKMTLEDGMVSERNFDSYKWQNITKIPELEIHIVENGIFPSGVGEPATCVVAPAIGNAIFNATGVRLRSLPFSREELFEGLDKKA